MSLQKAAADLSTAFTNFINQIAADAGSAAVEQQTAKRGRKTATETATEAAAAPTQQPLASTAPPANPATPALVFKDVADRFVKLAEKNRDVGVGIVKAFGVTRLSEITDVAKLAQANARILEELAKLEQPAPAAGASGLV